MQNNITAPAPASVLLPKYMAVFFTLWQAMLMATAFPRVTDIYGFDVLLTEDGHKYTASYYDADDKQQAIGNPLPADNRLLWPQLATTRQCERFSVLMKNLVEARLKLLFGPSVEVRWVLCKPKPICVFVPNKDMARPTLHSVLEIVLPDKTVWIFDGTLAQYGYDFTKIWLVPKDEYEANYTLPANKQFWEPVDENIQHFVGLVKEEYNGWWMEAWDLMKKVMDGLDWRALANCTVKEVCDIVAPLALAAFKGSWVIDEGESEEDDEAVLADTE